MPEPKSIYELLPEVQRAIGGISKDNVNAHQRYNFRGIDDVLNAIGPALAKHGVTVTAQVVKHRLDDFEHIQFRNGQEIRGTRTRCVLKLRVTFWGPDGSSLVNCTVGEAQDHNGDKATNKAMSVAFKYAAFMGLAIPVDPGVMDDSDHDDKPEGGTLEPVGKSKGSKASPKSGKKETSPPAKPSSGRSASSSKPAQKDGSGESGNGGGSKSASKTSTSAKGGSKAATRTTAAKQRDRKSPPNAFDGKPAHDKQLQEIASMILTVTGEDDPKADINQKKVRGLLDYVNGQRPGLGIEGEAKTIKDLFYVEAEKCILALRPQVKKAQAAADDAATNE